jgi:hypothetical protein
MLIEELELEQEVMVVFFHPSFRVIPGRVVKIARRYVTIAHSKYADAPAIETEFDIESQVERGYQSPKQNNHYAARFRTLEAHDLITRREAALHALRELKLGIAHDIIHEHPLELVEALIELVRGWPHA